MSEVTPTPDAPQARSSTPWHNWSKNLSYAPPPGSQYYVMPRNVQELRAAVVQAAAAGKKVRVSGQRHSQPPLVASSASQSADELILIDLSGYADLGADGSVRTIVNGNTVTVNAGVREDEIDVFLARNKLMLKTVTAGGFFSAGGMTAVDVHGATVDAPIFAETAIAFSIMGPDGTVTTIDADSPPAGGWSPLQFARVSLGMLGVVTAVTLEVIPRPFANSLIGGMIEGNWYSEADFVSGFGALLASKTRVETFFNPYSGRPLKPFTVCWCDVDNGSGASYTPPVVENSCRLANQDRYGAPYPPEFEKPAAAAALAAQEDENIYSALAVTGAAVEAIKGEVAAANARFSDLRLNDAARASFMSYFVELPDLGPAGLGLVWNALQSVKNLVTQNDNFHLATPLEFRFVRGGRSALAGTFSDRGQGAYFVAFDLIAFVAENAAGNGLVYTRKMMQLFATVEREWVALGGWPHNGKMYGFYDPNGASGNYSGPFNPAFVTWLRQRRAARVQAFDAYRQLRDPRGMFRNDFLELLTGP